MRHYSKARSWVCHTGGGVIVDIVCDSSTALSSYMADGRKVVRYNRGKRGLAFVYFCHVMSGEKDNTKYLTF